MAITPELQEVVSRISKVFKTDDIPKDRRKNNERTKELQELTKSVKKQNSEDIKNNNNLKKNYTAQLKELEEQKKLLNKAGKLDARTEKNIDKESIAIQKKQFQMELKTSSPSKRKEMIKEQAGRDKKLLTATQRVGLAIGDFADEVKEMKGTDNKFLKGAAMIALLFLLPKILNSQLLKDTVKFVEDKVIPNLKKLKDFFVDTFGENSLLIAGIVGITMILKPGLIIKPIMLAVKGLRLAFIAVQFFINNKLTRGLLNIVKGGKIQKAFMVAIKGLRAAFMAIRTFMMATLIPAITTMLTAMAGAIAPLLIPAALIIAGAVAVVGIFKSINDFFNEFNAILEDTGSVSEAIKGAISRFLGTLIAFIPGLFIKLIGFVAKLFGFEEFAKNLPSIGEISDIITGGIMDAVNFVSDFFRKMADFVKDKIKGALSFLGFGKKEEDMTEEELNEKKTEELLDEQKDETRRRTRLASKLSREQRQLQRDTKAAEKAYDEGEITAEELETVKSLEKSGIKAMAENRFFLEKSRETEDALKADLKSENFRIARGEGEFGQGDMSGMTKTAALKAQEARIDKINDQMLEKYGFQTNQQGAPVIINNDSSIRSNSSNTQTVNETITPRDGMLVSATADF